MELNILTPTKKFFSDTVVSVALVGYQGGIVIKPRHTPYITALGEGVIRITTAQGEEQHAAIMGGFAEVSPNKITLLTDTAEWPDEIDCPRAEEAKERAANRLDSPPEEELDRERALKALRRAEIRLKLNISRGK